MLTADEQIIVFQVKELSQIFTCLATYAQITPLPPNSISCLNPHTFAASLYKLLSTRQTSADYPKITIVKF